MASSNSTVRLEKLGRDVGCDSMADVNHAQALRHYLDTLEQIYKIFKLIMIPKHLN